MLEVTKKTDCFKDKLNDISRQNVIKNMNKKP